MKRLCLIVLIVAFAIPGFFLVSCGPGTPGGKGRTATVSAEKSLEAAEKALDEARKSGAERFDAGEVGRQAGRIEDGRRLLAEGKTKEGSARLGSAERALRDLRERAESAAARAAELEARRKAEAAAVETARREETRRDLDKADRQKAAALEAERQALAASALDLAPEALARARRSVREGDAEHRDGRYLDAYERYRIAEDGFVEALSLARLAAESKTPGSKAGGETGGEASHEQASAAGTIAGGAAGVAGERGGAAEVAAPLAPPATPPLSDDEKFLRESFRLLASRAVPEYDSETGRLTIQYLSGGELVKDLLFPRGAIPSNYIYFKPPGIPANPAPAGFIFGANTNGLFLLPFPFSDEVTVEIQVELGLMKNDGAISVILMASPDAGSRIAANFGTVEEWSGGKRIKAHLPRDPEFRRSPNYWFKKDRRGMRIRLEPSPAKPGETGKWSKVSIWYDTDDLTRDEPITVARVPARSGLVGFSWYMTKFHVRRLWISGTLDKPAAVKALREKIATKEKRRPAEEAPPAPPADQEATGEEAAQVARADRALRREGVKGGDGTP